MLFGLHDMLFHYTDRKGFFGIIQSQKIFLTAIRCQKWDRSEFLYALNFTHDSIQELRKEYPKHVETFLLEFDSQINQFQKTLETQVLNIFVFSFTNLDNDPRLWDKFSQKGNGYCICFDAMILNSIAISHHAQFQQCIYEVDVQRQTIRNALNEGISYFHSELELAFSIGQDTLTSAQKAAGYYFLVFMTKYAPFLKKAKAGFDDEKEWRLSICPELYHPEYLANQKWFLTRTGNDGHEIDYIAIDLWFKGISPWIFPVRKVYVRDTTNVDEAKRCAERFLLTYGIDNCEVVESRS